MSDAVNQHKIATILACIENGLSPAEAAVIFRKQAEAIHKYCDHLVEERNKVASGWAGRLLSPAPWKLLAAAAVGVPVAAYMGGHFAGDQAARVLTPTSEVNVPTIQKADEILRMKKETADILARVEARKKEKEKKQGDRSVRALY